MTVDGATAAAAGGAGYPAAWHCTGWLRRRRPLRSSIPAPAPGTTKLSSIQHCANVSIVRSGWWLDGGGCTDNDLPSTSTHSYTPPSTNQPASSSNCNPITRPKELSRGQNLPHSSIHLHPHIMSDKWDFYTIMSTFNFSQSHTKHTFNPPFRPN